MGYSTFPTIVEDCRRIGISDLKRLGYLKTGQAVAGMLCWGDESRVFVRVDTVMFEILFNYTWQKKHEIRYRVNLCSKTANLGFGTVWYFRCPVTNCLCRNLYLHNGYFVSRRAIPGIMYRKQVESKKYREIATMYGAAMNDEYRYPKKYAKLYYRGKPTPQQKKSDKWERKLVKGYNLIKAKGLL
jgi:hypothetical protein